MSNALSGSEAPDSPLIGHAVPDAVLSRALQSGRLAHAYLFHGPRSVGKRSAARVFASAIQCERLRGAAGDPTHPGLRPCGVCDSCRRVAAGTHPDVIEVEPDTATGQNISVKQAGAVVASAALRPKSGARRIFIVANAELLHEDAANALLKTLEEPGEFGLLLLCAPNQELLLPTIRSRCQPVRFDPVPAAVIAAALEERHGVDPAEAAAVARAAAGCPGTALGLLQDEALLARRTRILDLLDAALRARAHAARDASQVVAALRLADDFRAVAQDARGPAEKGSRSGGEGQRPLKAYLADQLELGLAYLRDILVMGSGAEDSLLQHPDRREQLEGFARELAPREASQLIDLLRETGQVLDRNVAPQLALERMFLNFVSPQATR